MSDTRPVIDFNTIEDEATRARARAEAYVAVFDTPQGRIVLADILLGSGIAEIRGPSDGENGRAYLDGKQDMAREIFFTAGFSPVDTAAVILTAGKGYYDERRDPPE